MLVLPGQPAANALTWWVLAADAVLAQAPLAALLEELEQVHEER